MTVGIGVLAESMDMVIVGCDMRATFPRLGTAHEECAKAWILEKPFQCGVAVAGKLRIAQPFVDYLTFNMTQVAKEPTIYREHVETAIDAARFRIWKRLLDWEMKKSYGLSLSDWQCGKVPAGKLDPLTLKAGKVLIATTQLDLEALVAGFVNGQLLFYKASVMHPLEAVSTPGVQVIGTGGALAMAHLNRRGQNTGCSLARSILHVAEALDEAKKEPKGTVGKSAWILAISSTGEMAYVLPNHPTLLGWKKAYAKRDSTSSLQNCKLSEIQAKGMTKPLVLQKSVRRQ